MSKDFIIFKKGSIVPQRIAKGLRKTKHRVKFGVEVQAKYRNNTWHLTTEDKVGSLFCILNGAKKVEFKNIHFEFASAFKVEVNLPITQDHHYEQ